MIRVFNMFFGSYIRLLWIIKVECFLHGKLDGEQMVSIVIYVLHTAQTKFWDTVFTHLSKFLVRNVILGILML